VTFRCYFPTEAGGGTLDRAWSLQDGVLVGAALHSPSGIDRREATELLARAAEAGRGGS
jgi:hypothetical protein